MESRWRQPDEMFEEERPFDLRSMMIDALKEPPIEPEHKESDGPDLLDLPKRRGNAKKTVMDREYLKAVHLCITKGIQPREISNRYGVTLVALRIHRYGKCLCTERGII